jgi:dUTP pyrophosphatase
MSDLKVKVQYTEDCKRIAKAFNIDFSLKQNFPLDAGWDMRACIDGTGYIPARGITIIPSGLMFELEPGWEIQIRPRSGLAFKNGITILNAPGTIDYTYRKEVMFCMFNASGSDYKVLPGERLGQACFRRVPTVEFEYVDQIQQEIDLTAHLSEKDRLLADLSQKMGIRGGMGSSGTK